MGRASGRNSRGPRIVAWLFALIGALVAPASVHAQTFTWNQPTTNGAWTNSANWSPSGGPPNVAESVAVFGNVATGPNTVVLPGGGVTIGVLLFTDVTTNSLSSAYIIGSATESITFNNAAATSLITVGGFTAATQTVAANVIIGNSQPLTIVNNGAPGRTALVVSGQISSLPVGSALVVDGSSNTTISGTIAGSVNTLTKNGTGVLTLTSASNAYTGGTVINNGVVSIGANAHLGAAAGGVTLNGGALHFSANFATGRSFTLGTNGGTIITTTGDGGLNNPTLTGQINGTGGLTFDGGGYVFLENNNQYAGSTVINNAGVTLVQGGRLSGTSSIRINGFVGRQVGILSLDNVLPSDPDRVNNLAPITLNGGLLSFVPGILGPGSETFGGLTVRGFGSIFGNQIIGGFGTGVMTFGALARDGNDPFTTLYVGGPIDGPSGAGATTQITFSSGLTNSTGSGTQIQVVPWIGGDNGGTSGAASGYANTLFIHDADGLRALNPNGSDFQQVGSGGAWNGGLSTRNNSITGDPAAVTGTITIMALVQNTSSAGSSTITGGGTLTVSSGAIANANGLIFNGPTLNFGANTGYLYLGNEFYIIGSSSITGTNGLVVTSNSTDDRNTLFLTNTTNPNAFTGGLYLNGTARVAFDTADSQLGAAGQKISFRGGTLRYTGASGIVLETASTPRPLELAAAGGGLISIESASGILTVPGVISGPEQLSVNGPGTLILSNASNTYTGGTSIGETTVAIGGAGSLGTGSVNLGYTIGTTQYSGGTLRFDFSGTLASNINHAFSHTINTNSNNVVLSGVISGAGTLLTKSGAGTLTLAGNNTYAGNTRITGGTLLVTNTLGSGTGYGSVAVENGGTLGGTGIVAGPVTLVSGGKLVAGTPGAAGVLSLRGKTTLVSGSTFQSNLGGATAGTQYGQLVIVAGGSIDLGSATLLATNTYNPSFADRIFLIDNQNSTGGLSGTFASGSTYTFVDGTTAQVSYVGDFGSNALLGGNDVVMHSFVPVPEPGSVLALAAVALGGVMWRKRKQKATLMCS